jgi:hypothetical protein
MLVPALAIGKRFDRRFSLLQPLHLPQRWKQVHPEPRMDAKAVGDAVAYMAGLPLDANELFMAVIATKMPFGGRG